MKIVLNLIFEEPLILIARPDHNASETLVAPDFGQYAENRK